MKLCRDLHERELIVKRLSAQHSLEGSLGLREPGFCGRLREEMRMAEIINEAAIQAEISE